jgi:hypothetical protein
MSSLIKNESWGIEDDQIICMDQVVESTLDVLVGCVHEKEMDHSATRSDCRNTSIGDRTLHPVTPMKALCRKIEGSSNNRSFLAQEVIGSKASCTYTRFSSETV